MKSRTAAPHNNCSAILFILIVWNIGLSSSYVYQSVILPLLLSAGFRDYILPAARMEVQKTGVRNFTKHFRATARRVETVAIHPKITSSFCFCRCLFKDKDKDLNYVQVIF